MLLWDLVKSTFEDRSDSVWIDFCDLTTANNNKQLKFKDVFELSEILILELSRRKGEKGRNNRSTIVGLWFDQNSENILGHFVALIACLRSVSLL